MVLYRAMTAAVTPAAVPTAAPRVPDAAARLLQVRDIYAEPAALDSPRGRDVLARFPGATVFEVPSHWQIPELNGNEGNIDRWVRVKTETLVLGVKKSLTARPNSRSSNWIAPSTANGCAMACHSFPVMHVTGGRSATVAPAE